MPPRPAGGLIFRPSVGADIRITAVSTTVRRNVQDDGGRFIRGAQRAAVIAHREMAQRIGLNARRILEAEVRERAAGISGPDFNMRRSSGQMHLRSALVSEQMFVGGPFGFQLESDYLDRNPATRHYWRGVHDGRRGQSFPIYVYGNARARAPYADRRRGRRSGRGRVIEAVYRRPGYHFLTRAFEESEGRLRGGEALAIYKREFDIELGAKFRGNRFGAVPRGPGIGLPRTPFRLL